MFCTACSKRTETEPCQHCGAPTRLAGRYRLEEVIGRGASGVTWRAVDPTGKAVAIKAISLEQVAGPKERELVEREVRVLREIEHPGIPSYVEHLVVGEEEQAVLWLVQDLVEGRSLAQELEEHRYTAREVLGIVAELADILRYLHELTPPVIHRDVKPGNVMRRPGGALALIDFGSVRDVTKGTVGGSTVAGTFGYMAPEQFAGDAEARSDLYGLGALAVALLTRKEPQALTDHANRLNWAKHTRVPDGVHDLINRLVEPEIERRAPSAAWVAQRARTMLEAGDLERVVQKSSVQVDRVLEKKPRDRHWWLMAGGILLCGAMVPVAFLLREPPPVVFPDRIDGPNLLTPPDEDPRTERAISLDDSRQDQLARIVRTLGEDGGVSRCVERWSSDHPDDSIQLEVHLEPPATIGAVHVGPRSLAETEVARCLEKAAAQVVFRDVALERPGSVTLGFD